MLDQSPLLVKVGCFVDRRLVQAKNSANSKRWGITAERCVMVANTFSPQARIYRRRKRNLGLDAKEVESPA